jgi:hypothetical protein
MVDARDFAEPVLADEGGDVLLHSRLSELVDPGEVTTKAVRNDVRTVWLRTDGQGPSVFPPEPTGR